MSATNDSSVNTVLSAPSGGASAVRETPLSTGSTGLSSPGSLTVSLSIETPVVAANEHGQIRSLRGHPRVKTLLSIFSVVEVVSVRMTVFQSTVLAASAEGTATHLVRFGIVPRSTALDFQSSGVVHYIPFLESMVTSTNVGSSARAVFGEGGVPFPPGLQLDLRAVETRHNYPEVLVANTFISKLKHNLVQAQVDFTVRCSGQNFGALY